jgi:SET domain-containing protein
MEHKFFWLNPKLKVTKTKKYGYGTFAKENIKKGERLLVLSGYVLLLSEEENLPDGLNDNGIQVTEDLSLCVTKKEDLGGINFFNHSCNPNAGIKGQIFLVAMKSIKAGEEVTFDYAMTLCQSKNAQPYHLECLCGKRNCRKVITDSDWKMPELQKKYDGYFQYYIQEKIDALKKRK